MTAYDIGIDIRMIWHTGIGTYLRGILSEFLKGETQTHKIGLFYPPQYSEHPPCRAQMFSSPIYSIREQWEYPRHLRLCKLWHAPHYNVPIWKGKTKVIVTIHDIIHWIFRREFRLTPLQIFYAGRMLTQAVRQSDHILTVSENTKKDLVEHFSADPSKVSVIYEGVSERFCPDCPKDISLNLEAKYHLPPRFFLYVGMIKPHKNVAWLAELFLELHQKGVLQLPLVIVGKLDPKDHAAGSILRRAVQKGVVLHIPQAGEEELPVLYRKAAALVHPSLYEGFGLTLLEAMACGTPVLAWRVASIPEVAGKAAYLIHCKDFTGFTGALRALETQESLRSELSRKGLEHVQKFLWERTARETLKVYERVLNKK